MTNTELLFIRACKSKEPKVRIRSVYRRFYFNGLSEADETNHISGILADIVDNRTTAKISTRSIIEMFNYDPWQTKAYIDRVCDGLVGTLRYTNVNELDGYIAPAWLRNGS